MKGVYAMPIITIFDDKTGCLSQKAQAISLNVEGLKEAKMIADQLITTLIPLMPAAGLAAPQIGISKQVFIYSWDRSIENMEVAINPKIMLFDPKTHMSWEACFSTMQANNISQAALVTRAQSLIVEYFNLNGDIVKKKLEGFAAKVFQHEYDHLQGIENVKKADAQLKSFSTSLELEEFMKQIKQTDAVSYLKPTPL